MNNTQLETAMAAYLRAWFDETVTVRESHRPEPIPAFDPFVLVEVIEAEKEVEGLWLGQVLVAVQTPALIEGASPETHEEMAASLEEALHFLRGPVIAAAFMQSARVLAHGWHLEASRGGNVDGKWVSSFLFLFGFEDDSFPEMAAVDLAALLGDLPGGLDGDCKLGDAREATVAETVTIPAGLYQAAVALSGSVDFGAPGNSFVAPWDGVTIHPAKSFSIQPGAVAVFSWAE